VTKAGCDNVNVTFPLRRILADSHISAITIAVLLLWSLSAAFQAVWYPLLGLLEYLFTAVATLSVGLGLPYSGPFYEERVSLLPIPADLFTALTSFAAAWVLARWIYGNGPLRILSRYGNRIAGSNDAKSA
jgi:hypothetical protein